MSFPRRWESRLFFVMLNKFCASLVVDPEINSGRLIIIIFWIPACAGMTSKIRAMQQRLKTGKYCCVDTSIVIASRCKRRGNPENNKFHSIFCYFFSRLPRRHKCLLAMTMLFAMNLIHATTPSRKHKTILMMLCYFCYYY